MEAIFTRYSKTEHIAYQRNSRVKAKRQLLKQQYDYAKMKHLGLDKSLRKLNQDQLILINKQLLQI